MPKLRGDDMLKWFRERKIAKSVEVVKIFVNENYKESPKTPSGTSSGIRYSRRAEPKFSRNSEPQTKYSYSEEPEAKNDETSEVKYSLKTLDIKFSDRDVQYSFRDNYDSQSIDRAVRSLSSSDSPLKALRTLEINTNMSFVDKMLDYINIKHMRDSDVLKLRRLTVGYFLRLYQIVHINRQKIRALRYPLLFSFPSLKQTTFFPEPAMFYLIVVKET